MRNSGHKDEEVEVVYKHRRNGKCEEKLQLYNHKWVESRSREGQEGDAFGKCGLRVRNNRGKSLTDFCKENELIITNTIFQQYPSRRYTWVKPGGTTRYQIDYIMVKRSIKYTYSKAKLALDVIYAVTIISYKI